jgi:hypothetical protein
MRAGSQLACCFPYTDRMYSPTPFADGLHVWLSRFTEGLAHRSLRQALAGINTLQLALSLSSLIYLCSFLRNPNPNTTWGCVSRFPVFKT